MLDWYLYFIWLKKLDELLKKLSSNPNTSRVSKEAAHRFLQTRSYDVDKAYALIESDCVRIISKQNSSFF